MIFCCAPARTSDDIATKAPRRHWSPQLTPHPGPGPRGTTGGHPPPPLGNILAPQGFWLRTPHGH
jgi:hypothetical protein